MKNIILVMPVVVLAGAACAQSSMGKAAADRDYEAVYKVGFDKAHVESKSLEFRNLTLAFVHKYPQDPRRFELLSSSALRCVLYAKRPEEADARIEAAGGVPKANLQGLQVDEPKERAWNQFFRTQFAAAAKDSHVLPRNRMVMGANWIEGEDLRSRILRDYDLAKLQSEIELVANACPDQDLSIALSGLVDAPKSKLSGLDNLARLKRFDKPLLQTRNSFLVTYLEGKQRYLQLLQHPLELNFVAMDGRKVDLKDYRGKFVYIDIWSTYCSGCVANLPRLKRVYDKFKPRGLEVISVALDIDERRDKVETILKQGGIEWPNWFTGGKSFDRGPTKDFEDKYGIRGMPVTLLLDPKGNLLEANTDVTDLEPALEKYLGSASAKETQSK